LYQSITNTVGTIWQQILNTCQKVFKLYAIEFLSPACDFTEYTNN